MGKLSDKVEEIISLYEQYNSIRAISKILDASPSGVKRILNKYNVPMRNKCESLNLCPKSFTHEEEEFLIGTLLGDGHIVRQKSNKSECHFYIAHSIKQKDYISYKYEVLKRFIGCNLYESFPIVNGKKYHNINFITRKSPLFTKYRNLFYNKYNKILPLSIIENLSDFSFAIWYMDDGYHYPSKGIELNSQSFTKKENEQIMNIISDKFNLNNLSLRRVNKGNYKIYISKEDKYKIFDRISKYIIPSMLYKVSESSEAIRWASEDEDMVRTFPKGKEI